MQHSQHNTATAHSKHYTASCSEHLDTFVNAAEKGNRTAALRAKPPKQRCPFPLRVDLLAVS